MEVGSGGLVFAAGTIVVALSAFPLFAMIESGSTPLLFLGVIMIMGLGHPLMYGPQAALYSELFPPQVRYSGASLGYQNGGMLGGLVPAAGQCSSATTTRPGRWPRCWPASP